MEDPTESIRRARVRELNESLSSDEKTVLAELERSYGRVWTRDELREEYEIISFLAPYVLVRERATGKKGTMEFTHMPRFYFSFQLDEK